MRDLPWWLLHVAGIDDVSGRWYAFYSGIGSDFGELVAAVAFLAGVWLAYRKTNCHVRWCWRVGRFAVESTPYVVCHRHHPTGAPTGEHVLRLHLHRQRAWAATPGTTTTVGHRPPTDLADGSP